MLTWTTEWAVFFGAVCSVLAGMGHQASLNYVREEARFALWWSFAFTIISTAMITWAVCQ